VGTKLQIQDERVNLLFELEELDFTYDLRALNSSKQQFDVFWSKAKEFLGLLWTHRSCSYSKSYFCEQVQQRCPPEWALIYSYPWINGSGSSLHLAIRHAVLLQSTPVI